MKAGLISLFFILFTVTTANANQVGYLPRVAEVQVDVTLRNIQDSAKEIANKYSDIAETDTSFAEFTQLAESGYQKALTERTKLYEATKVELITETRSASLGTKVNFSEERKNIVFTVEAPEPGLIVESHNLNIKKTRGLDKRISRAQTTINANQSVSFGFTLIEPNASEKNIHVNYSAKVVYSIPSDVARRIAKRDLRSFRAKLDEEISSFPLLHAQAAEAGNSEKIALLSELIVELKKSIEQQRDSFDANRLKSEPVQQQEITIQEDRGGIKLSEVLFLLVVPLLVAIISGILGPLMIERYKNNRKTKSTQEEASKIIVPD